MTHYNDVVPHLPALSQGFNHAGDEVWYYNAGADLSYKICGNAKGLPESQSCSDSVWVTGTDAHSIYVGQRIS